MAKQSKFKCFFCSGFFDVQWRNLIDIDGVEQEVCVRCKGELEQNEKKMLAEAGIDYKMAEGQEVQDAVVQKGVGGS